MKSMNLFYDVMNLFNTSEEAFELYYRIKQRIQFSRETKFGRSVLLVFLNNEMRDRKYKELSVKTNFRRQGNYILTTFKDEYVFATIEQLKDDRFLAGRRFTDIKFMG